VRLRLFHISEEPTIHTFEPRLSTVAPHLGPVVWAIAESHLANYLLPRECPRVTFAAAPETSNEDRLRFGIDAQSRVIVIEAEWLPRVMACTLYRYELRPDAFELFDSSAGYWVSYHAVEPMSVQALCDLPREITKLGAELRAVDRLQPLRDAVASSTLVFSMIRMRNATN
jgi:hypothetical protein